MQMDYMKAYFDFQLPKEDGFQTARAIVEKYKNNKLETFRFKQFFAKLELQLQDYDQKVDSSALVKDLNEKEKLDIKNELNKKKIASIEDVKVDDTTGVITIESQNID